MSVLPPLPERIARVAAAAGGACRIIALLMPVRASMWVGMRTPAFIRLW